MAADQEFNLNIEMETLFCSSKNISDYNDLDVKLEDDEEDELGPIVDTPFRARCYTWPRQYLQQQQEALEAPPLNSSTTSFLHQQEQQQQQQQENEQQGPNPEVVNPESFSVQKPGSIASFSLPQVSEELSAENTESLSSSKDLPSCGSPKQKNSSRRNAWGNLSYADLITQAIQSAPEQRLTLSQIYEWVVKNVPYFKDKGDSASSSGWKNSIRHNLSLHSRFRRVHNEGQGKSSWWMMNPDAAKGTTLANMTGNPNNNSKHCSLHHHGHASHVHYRRRSNTLESASRLIEKRKATHIKRRDSSGSIRSAVSSGSRRDLQRTSSSGSLSYPESPEFTMRPRTLSNASSCGGRMSPQLRPLTTLSNASSTATLEAIGSPLDSQQQPQQQPWPQCHSPIFNYIEKLRLDEGTSLEDDLEDINNLIDTEVGVENLRQQQNQFDNSHLMTELTSSSHQFNQPQPSSNRIKILEPRNEDIPISAEQLGNNGPLGVTNSNTSKQILKIRSLQLQSQQTEPLSNWHVPIISADPISQHSEQQQQTQSIQLQQNSTLFNLLTQNTITTQQQLSAEDNNIIEEFLNYELPTGNNANPEIQASGQDSKMLSIPTTLSLGTI